MTNGFYAMLSRMKLIQRWSLMRNTSTENIQEHSLQVAIIAHALALLRRQRFGEGRYCPDPEHVMALAVFHDAAEIITGDMPTPIKYFTSELRGAYQAAEDEAVMRLLSMLPVDMREHYSSLLLLDPSNAEESAAHELVKAADRISAYLKCVEEEMQGNREFGSAKHQTLMKINGMRLPEVDYFMQEYAPAFAFTLDELQQN